MGRLASPSLAELPQMNPGPVCRLTLAGVIELANDAAARIFGRDDLVGRSWLDLSPSLTEPFWREVVSQAASHQYEETLGGRTFVFTVVHPAGGHHAYVYGTDISDLKAAERALEAHAAELAELARFPDMNPGPVLRVDLDGTILLANRAARGLWPGEDLTGRSFLALCADLDAETWKRALTGVVEWRYELTVDDRCLTFTLAHEPGSAFAFLYGADVTDLKAAERRVAHQAAELREMARFPEMNPGPVCRLDREATILLANRAARDLFDDPALVGKRWTDLCPGMDARRWERIVAATERTAHEARVQGRELVFTHTPGAREQFVFAYGADITDQKTTERALRQADKLATLGTLAAGVAHELNNPAAAAQRAATQLGTAFAELQEAQLQLSQCRFTDEQRRRLVELDAHARAQAACGCDLDALALADREAEIEQWLEAQGVPDAWTVAPHLASMGYVPAELDRVTEGIDPEAHGSLWRWLCRSYTAYTLLEEVRLGAGRVSEIVTALKAYSYVGQAPIQAVDVNQGLRNTLIVLRSRLKQGVTVEQELAELPRVQAYGSELNQVWTNLIDNAIQAMNGKGTIRIRTMPRDARVLVDIEDDGPGIPADIQPRIFDPFFTTKPPGEGTGLGLHTCYTIVVKKHGGTIEVTSEPGRTRFTVALPLKAPSTEAATEPGPE